jgi:hypothetical protein
VSDSPTNSDFAQIEVLPADYANKILSAQSVSRVRTFYGIFFPLAVIGGIGLLVWAANCHNAGIEFSDKTKVTRSSVLFCAGIFLLVSLLLVRIAVGNRSQWLRRVARREVNRRPDRIVNPDASGVRFVEIVPRSNWNDLTLLENATDVGFIEIDAQRKRLLYEGDNERYRIPAKAIVGCKQDYYTRLIQDPYSRGPNNRIIYFHFVVVTLRISENMTTDIPFRIRQKVNLSSDEKARHANYEFFHQVNQLTMASDSGTVS